MPGRIFSIYQERELLLSPVVSAKSDIRDLGKLFYQSMIKDDCLSMKRINPLSWDLSGKRIKGIAAWLRVWDRRGYSARIFLPGTCTDPRY